MSEPRIVPVILSGGEGTRLWPVSSAKRPKQLHRLIGETTLLQTTAMRVADPALFEAPVVIGSAALADEVEAQLVACGRAPAQLILEPEGRNTAPAMALAAVEADGETLLLAMPSDHRIADEDAYMAAIRAGMPLARQGWLVTFGIRPESPETGYGYIRRGEEIAPGVFRAERFVEKPDRATAEHYVEEGCYDWNGGIFLFRADTLIAELTRHAPEILEPVTDSVGTGTRDGNRLHPEPGAFRRAKAQSIDHALMEKAERVAVVPVRMGWSDIGSWDALHDVGEPDAEGNVASGDVLALGARNCSLRSEGPTIVALGVEDLVVVATADAVLVSRRGDTQRVREAVERLKDRSQSGGS